MQEDTAVKEPTVDLSDNYNIPSDKFAPYEEPG